MTKTLELTKKLVSLPSWVGTGCDEIKVAEFIYGWLCNNTKLKITKQPVKNGRFNVIATDGYPTRLLLAGHIDTVEPRAGWNTDPFTPTLVGSRLYGLGATDMKGSLSACMTTLSSLPKTKGVMFLAYCDEEYDFAGMRTFIKKCGNSLRPELVISLDGYCDSIGTGCRGLIEVSFKLRGKTGHAGRPEQGINAISLGVEAINRLKTKLAKVYCDPSLGPTTLNLAYCQGGLDLGNNRYGRQGNNIANIAEYVLDIRPATPELTASKLRKLITSLARSSNLKLIDWKVRHDLGSWTTLASDITKKTSLSGNFETFGGYVDTQMIWKQCGKPTCLAIGAATRSVAHAPNEYLKLQSLQKTEDIIAKILNKYLK
ncbi:MAG: M20/M25/M40 family metallo-hydrolase [bacterium]